MKSDIGYLKHILNEIQFLKEKSLAIDENHFLSDETLKRAFVRSIEIIGEASNKLSNEFTKTHFEPEWKKLSATRNRLIHGYFIVDYQIVWDLIKNKIPVLESQIRAIIENEKTLFD